MAYIKSLKISEYKGFFDEESLNFAIPDKVKEGSGLTLIVGPNNTGKTTILEALLLDKEKKFKESERHDKKNPKIIKKDSLENILEYSNIDNGSQIKVMNDHVENKVRFEIIQSRRHWNYQSPNSWNNNTFSDQSVRQEIRNASGLDTAAVLKEINKNEQQKQKFNELMKRLNSNFTNWTIDSNDIQDYVKYITGNKISHQANWLGDGMLSLFRICAHLVSEDTDKVLIIDEPELSLHPNSQKALSLLMSEESRQRQIILCTHSPYFVRWQDFLGGANFVRLNKIDDKKCTISVINNNKQYSQFIESNCTEWQKPQLLDIVAKEILFLENILFVEGQEDVGLIKKWASKNGVSLNFDIFGYGVGSYSSMKLFLEMANDLGIVKVGALYDSGPDADKCYEKDRNINQNYCLQKLETNDIRDKLNKCSKCQDIINIKEGCFDESGKLKDEKKDHFEGIMNNFIKYFEKT